MNNGIGTIDEEGIAEEFAQRDAEKWKHLQDFYNEGAHPQDYAEYHDSG